MQTLAKIRLTNEQMETLEAGKVVKIPASWEEFEEFLTETDYRAEYYNDHIIIMGLVTLIHELLISQFIYLLKRFYQGKPFYVVGSNTGIRRDGKRRHYNGDVVVIKGKPALQDRSQGIVTNPYLIVEILSESTIDYELGTKRRKYEEINTVQELVFVDPMAREVIVCRRTDIPNVWTETLYTTPNETVDIDGYTIKLTDIFADLPEEE